MKFDFGTHRCRLTKNGFDVLPDSMAKVCEDAVVLSKGDNSIVLCDRNDISAYINQYSDCSKEEHTAILRYIFMHSDVVESAEETAAEILKDFESSDVAELSVEMRPRNMTLHGENTDAQYIEITILDTKSESE